MTLHLVLLSLMLAVSLASTQQCASSVGSRMDLSVHGHKNASGQWIITVDTRRRIWTEKQWELTINVHQQRRSCDNNEIEQLVSVTSVYPPSQDSPMSGGIESITSSSTTTNNSTTTTTTTAAPTITTTTTTTKPKSCPGGYQAFPGFNCYKVYQDEDGAKSWTDAREECGRNGGDLMVAETEREKDDVLIPVLKAVGFHFWPWMGVYIPEDGDGWMSVKGDPVLKAWWTPDDPENSAYKCGRSWPTGLLFSWDCAHQKPFICEVPL